MKNTSTLTERELAAKMLFFALATMDSRCVFSLREFNALSDSPSALSSAAKRLVAYGYAKASGDKLEFISTGKGRPVILSEQEQSAIKQAGNFAATLGNAFSANPYKEPSEQRDLWRAGWFEVINHIQSGGDADTASIQF